MRTALQGHTSFECRRIAWAARDHGGMASSPRRRFGSAARTKSLSPTLGSLSTVIVTVTITVTVIVAVMGLGQLAAVARRCKTP